MSRDSEKRRPRGRRAPSNWPVGNELAHLSHGWHIVRVRIPLAVKVLLAFVAVIAAGVVPIRWNLRHTLRTVATQKLSADLQQRATLLAERLYVTPLEDVPQTLTTVGPLMTERITLVSLEGKVLFESHAAREMANHLQRPEVADALVSGLGSAERVSESDGVAYLYVAVPMPGPNGTRAVLRLAAPQTVANRLAEQAVAVVEQGTALSVSLALLLSLMAVYAVVRPLRRMRDGAARLAAGELSLTLDVNTHDELEELARALEAVGAQLRARLAAAGSGDALVGQMVHAMVQGVLLLGPDGKVQHINGVARAKLGLRGPLESERLTHLLEAPVVLEALRESVKDPLGVDIRVPHPVSGALMDGVVVALRRPHGSPSHALILDVEQGDAATLLDIPSPQEVQAVPFRDLMDRVLRRVNDDVTDASVGFQSPEEWPDSHVVDAGGRVENAVTDTLRAAARAAGTMPSTPLAAHVEGHLLCLQLPVTLSNELVASLQPRLSPLGGRVVCHSGKVELWLPLA